jgi:hypothetical protein
MHLHHFMLPPSTGGRGCVSIEPRLAIDYKILSNKVGWTQYKRKPKVGNEHHWTSKIQALLTNFKLK